jgi:hypothetical protein
MRLIILIVICLGIGFELNDVAHELRALRWCYQFEHHEKTCNFAEICPQQIPNPPSHVTVQ